MMTDVFKNVPIIEDDDSWQPWLNVEKINEILARTNEWCGKYEIDLHVDTRLALGHALCMSAQERTVENKHSKDEFIKQLKTEARHAQGLQKIITRTDSFIHPTLNHVRVLINNTDGEGGGFILKKLSEMIEDIEKIISEFKSGRSGSRKVIIQNLQPIIELLSKKQFYDEERLQNKALADLFISLGYKNSSGKGDPATVANDILEMRGELDELNRKNANPS